MKTRNVHLHKVHDAVKEGAVERHRNDGRLRKHHDERPSHGFDQHSYERCMLVLRMKRRVSSRLAKVLGFLAKKIWCVCLF